MRAVVGEPAVQRAVRVVVLVGRDPVVLCDGIVVEVVKELRERIDVLDERVGEERHRVVLHGIIILAGAVVRIDGAVRSRRAVGRAGGQLHVFLIILPRDARHVQLRGQVRHVEDVAVGRFRVGIAVEAEIRASLRPDIIRLGRMDIFARVETGRGIRHLHRVRVARRDEAVLVRRRRVAEDRLRAGLAGRLREVMILHRDDEDAAGLGCLGRQQHAGHGGADQRGRALELSVPRTGECGCRVCVV